MTLGNFIYLKYFNRQDQITVFRRKSFYKILVLLLKSILECFKILNDPRNSLVRQVQELKYYRLCS